MGSDNSKPKPTSANPPVSPNVPLLKSLYPHPCDLNHFIEHLNLPAEHVAISSQLNATEQEIQTQVSKFGASLFSYMCKISPNYAEQDGVLDEKTYVDTIQIFLEGSNQVKTNLLIKIFCDSPSSKDEPNHGSPTAASHTTINITSIYNMISQVIALAGFLHLQEEQQIASFGYCIPDEPVNTSRYANFSSNNSEKDAFVPLHKLKKPGEDAANRPTDNNTDRVPRNLKTSSFETSDDVEPVGVIYGAMPKQEDSAKQDMPVKSYVVTDTTVKQLTPEEEEARLLKEIEEEELQLKKRQAKAVELDRRLVASIVISIFNFNKINVLQVSEKYFSNIDSAEGSKEDILSIMQLGQKFCLSFDQVRSWAEFNYPSFGYILTSLVKLNLTAKLTQETPEAQKKLYRRVAPLPDPVNMIHSTLWSNSTSWILSNIYLESKLQFASPKASDSTNNTTAGAAASWKLLYASGWHGHSLSRLITNVVGYKAETLFFVQTTKGHIFGAYLATPWDLSSSYFGNSSFFLFGLYPFIEVCRGKSPSTQSYGIATSQAPTNFAYCFNNPKSYTRRPVGIGFGGNYDGFRLSIDEDLLRGTCVSYDTTYETGTISPDTTFDIKSIEVWGASSDYADASLQRERRLREVDAQRARKAVNRGQAWHEGPDKFIMDLAGKTGSSDGYLESIEKERRQAKEREEMKAKLMERRNTGGHP